MSVKANKTSTMIFTRKYKIELVDQLIYGGVTIEYVKLVKYLGIL